MDGFVHAHNSEDDVCNGWLVAGREWNSGWVGLGVSTDVVWDPTPFNPSPPLPSPPQPCSDERGHVAQGGGVGETALRGVPQLHPAPLHGQA